MSFSPSSFHFTPAAFRFLEELAANNNRDWFQSSKRRYEEDVKEPALRFIADFAGPLREICPDFRADPRASGGSLFRIYRDTRFSKDKSPYKTHAGIHFRHEAARGAHAPGFYLHIEPGGSFAACGVWKPATPALTAIRQAIADDPEAWIEARDHPQFRAAFELSGASLKKAPRGMSADHPMIEDLKRKDFIGVAPLGEEAIVAEHFIDHFAALCRSAAPFQRWLCEALGAAWRTSESSRNGT